jgi:ParB/RepB/Spo0J family partition protein
MATTTQAPAGVQMIALDQIRTDHNIRQLAAKDVDALAASIRLLGQITPAIVRPDTDGTFVLVAGHKRHAALKLLGYSEIRAEIRTADADHAERAAENIFSCRRRHEVINADLGGMPTRATNPPGAWSPLRGGRHNASDPRPSAG